MTNKDKFFYPHCHYRGHISPENLVFNANLQEFAHKVGYIANLQTGGKMSPEQAYRQIEELWDDLSASKQQLGIDAYSA
jgi:hypothetical protein